MLLEVDSLEVAYGDYQVVWGVSLSVAAGESVALLGPNGSGKSTVVNAITGLVAAKAGDIRFAGASLVGRPIHHRAPLGLAHVLERRRVFPHLTVLQNLALGAWHPAAKAARPESVERVFSLFPRLAERQGQLARTLSGGEQQMLALGRALMARPRLLLLDEPSLGLAPVVIAAIFDAIQELAREGVTVLLVEQNAAEALQLAHRAYVIETGRIVLEGKAPDLLRHDRVREAYLGA
ncbi:MAG: ABC transporter ATP-binding protein [Candidatus Rokuibacteriota bacterium]